MLSAEHGVCGGYPVDDKSPAKASEDGREKSGSMPDVDDRSPEPYDPVSEDQLDEIIKAAKERGDVVEFGGPPRPDGTPRRF